MSSRRRRPPGFGPSTVQINSVISTIQIDASTIQVQVLDPTNVPTSPYTLKALITDLAQKNVSSPVSGYSDADIIKFNVGTFTDSFVAGQLITTLHGDGLSSPSSPFYSFCVDVFHTIGMATTTLSFFAGKHLPYERSRDFIFI